MFETVKKGGAGGINQVDTGPSPAGLGSKEEECKQMAGVLPKPGLA